MLRMNRGVSQPRQNKKKKPGSLVVWQQIFLDYQTAAEQLAYNVTLYIDFVTKLYLVGFFFSLKCLGNVDNFRFS